MIVRTGGSPPGASQEPALAQPWQELGEGLPAEREEELCSPGVPWPSPPTLGCFRCLRSSVPSPPGALHPDHHHHHHNTHTHTPTHPPTHHCLGLCVPPYRKDTVESGCVEKTATSRDGVEDSQQRRAASAADVWTRC